MKPITTLLLSVIMITVTSCSSAVLVKDTDCSPTVIDGELFCKKSQKP